MALGPGPLVHPQHRPHEHVPRAGQHHRRTPRRCAASRSPGPATGRAARSRSAPAPRPRPGAGSSTRHLRPADLLRHVGRHIPAEARHADRQPPLVPQPLVDRRHPHPGLQLRRRCTRGARRSPARSPAAAGYRPAPGTTPAPAPPTPARSSQARPGRCPPPPPGATYFRSVLRSTPRLRAISFFDRPACQCTSISVTSITSNVLLAIGLPSSQTGGRLLLLDGQVHHDTHAHPHGELRDRGGELRDRYPLRAGELHDRRHLNFNSLRDLLRWRQRVSRPPVDLDLELRRLPSSPLPRSPGSSHRCWRPATKRPVAQDARDLATTPLRCEEHIKFHLRASAATRSITITVHIGGSARGYNVVASRFRNPSRPAVGQHAAARPEYLCIKSRTENARSCRESVVGSRECFSRAAWRMPGLRDPAVTSGYRGIPRQPRPEICTCRCTCRFLTAPAAQEHHSQETAGLDLSPVTVLRCQGHPGNAAGPRSPPRRDPAAGGPQHQRAPPPARTRDRAHRPHKARPRRGQPTRHPRPDAGIPPGRPGTPGHHHARPATGPGRVDPGARQQDPRTHAAPRPGFCQPDAGSEIRVLRPRARPQPSHDPQLPRTAAIPLWHATAACTPAGT